MYARQHTLSSLSLFPPGALTLMMLKVIFVDSSRGLATMHTLPDMPVCSRTRVLSPGKRRNAISNA